jgi:hypothetical protein
MEKELRSTIVNLEERCAVYPASSNKQTPPPLRPGTTVKVGPTGSGNIQLVDCVVLLFSFVVVKLFA